MPPSTPLKPTVTPLPGCSAFSPGIWAVSLTFRRWRICTPPTSGPGSRRSPTTALAAASRAQHLSAARGFFRYLNRRHGVDINAIRLIATARVRPALPRALTVGPGARRSPERVGEVAEQAALQARDIAFFSLLYGCGCGLPKR